jgi:hypothetical protein
VGLDISDAVPHDLADIGVYPPLVITVCDQAHEELEPDETWLHWSIPDPVLAGTRSAFDRAVAELQQRIDGLVAAWEPVS